MNSKSLPAAAPKASKPVKRAAPPVRKAVAPAKKAAPAAPVAPAKKAAPAMPVAPRPKHKLVRDSFTIPKAEYLVLDALKVRAAGLARPVKKSELLRAGIGALNAMSDKAFLAAMNGVPSLKTGRPSAATPDAPAVKRTK